MRANAPFGWLLLLFLILCSTSVVIWRVSSAHGARIREAERNGIPQQSNARPQIATNDSSAKNSTVKAPSINGSTNRSGNVAPMRGATRQRLDLSTHYVLLGQNKAHPTHLVARRKRGHENEEPGALRPLNLAVIRTYSTPGWVLLDNADGVVPSRVASEAEARQRGRELLGRARTLMRSGAFDYAEPDYAVHADIVPNDSAFADGSLWGLQNTGQSNGVAGADIDAVRAWDITTGSSNIIVAVVDTGIRYTHQDLAAQMWRNPGEIPDNGIDDDGDGYVDNVFGVNTITGSGDPMDDQSHGTHVSGTIGAAANDGHPHVGVAWQVQLMACKFLDYNGEGFTSDAVEAIDFARLKGARVMSASWGAYGFSQALYDSIAAARDAGILFVAAAGNESLDTDVYTHSPASMDLDNIVSVAALDRFDRLAEFSNYGRQTVHLGAPGVDIFSSTAGADDEYQWYSGTSMATPHVTGVAALLLGYDPTMSLADLRLRLLRTTVSVADLAGHSVSWGRINAYQALTTHPDGILEVTVSTLGARSWLIGQTVRLQAQVSDLIAVTNATVTGALSDGRTLEFRNDGVAPDERASDMNYTASFLPPTNTGLVVLSLQVSAPGKTDLTTNFTFIVTNPPPNDLFADRIVITDNEPALPDSDFLSINTTFTNHATVFGNNFNAGKEPGEQLIYSGTSGQTVWWTFTPATSGVVRISTEGSTFDTALGVYTGDTVSNLTRVARNDGAYGGEEDWSLVDVTVYAGTAYHIVVDGWDGIAGEIVLRLEWSPPVVPYIWTDSAFGFFHLNPLHQFALPGKHVYFGVYADGTPPLYYQWQFNNSDILNATNWQYDFVLTNADQYGQYSVTISNLAGMITKGPALVEAPTGSLVSVFTDERYVDNATDLARSAFAVQESLWHLGHPVQRFTNISEAITNDVLVFPSQQIAPLTADLSESDRSALSNFVARGGTLIALGHAELPGNRTADLLNAIFGWSVHEGYGRGQYGLDISSEGTIFATGPPQLPPNLASTILQDGTLPPNARSIYTWDLAFEPAEQGSLVALIPHGAGNVVFFGWNWWFAVPVYYEDFGWLDLLEKATRLKEPPPPTPQPRLTLHEYGGHPDFRTLTFTNFPFETYTLLASTNLSDWSVLGSVRHSPGQPSLGSFYFWVGDDTNYVQRFYKVRREAR